MAVSCTARGVFQAYFLVFVSCCGPLAIAQEPANSENPSISEVNTEFKQLAERHWREVFSDPGTGKWQKRWFLDGQRATVTNTPRGMELRAGREFGNDADHMVLWTKREFTGDIKIDFEYTRLDSATRGVNILYIQAIGSGVGPYAKDIAQWRSLRTVPSMRLYFGHIHAYHISYAAFPNGNSTEDYIRARRYMPETNGLRGTDLTPDYFNTGLFKTGIPHKVTVIKQGQELFMYIRNEDKQMLCRWKNTALPAIVSGRIGLRHMYTRAARYENLRVSVLSTPSSSGVNRVP